MTSNPDIVIATPGRFLHLKVEMGLDLSSVRYVVFDEADRLFEMGFAAQLTEILQDRKSTRLNSSHDQISYAVFCLKKKKKYNKRERRERLSGSLLGNGLSLGRTLEWLTIDFDRRVVRHISQFRKHAMP